MLAFEPRIMFIKLMHCDQLVIAYKHDISPHLLPFERLLSLTMKSLRDKDFFLAGTKFLERLKTGNNQKFSRQIASSPVHQAEKKSFPNLSSTSGF